MLNNEENFSVDTEQLKNETKDTVNQVKETIKNVDFKKDTEETKGFVKEMFLNPFKTIQKIASGEENVLTKSVIIMILFIAIKVVYKIISFFKYGKYAGIGSNLLDLVAAFLHPIFYIGIPAIVVLMMNRKNKKPLTTVMCTLVAASIPIVINSVIDVVERIVPGIVIIFNPISTALSALAMIFTYFGLKDLFEEENESFIKKFAFIKLISSFIFVILSRIGIY